LRDHFEAEERRKSEGREGKGNEKKRMEEREKISPK